MNTTTTPDLTSVDLAKRTIAEMRRLHDELAALVAHLSADDLAKGSACAEWDVAQVLSHLGSGAEISLGTLAASLDGHPAPGQDANHVVWDRWNAMSRDAQRASWLEWSEKYVSTVEAFDDATLQGLRVQLSFLPEPLDAAGVTGMRLTEQALHTWDVASALDPDAVLAESSAALIQNRLPEMMRWAAKPGNRSGGVVDVHVTTRKPSGSWLLRLGDSVSLTHAVAETTPSQDEAQAATLTLDSETFVRLLTGRVRDADGSRVDVGGAVSVNELRTVFPGF